MRVVAEENKERPEDLVDISIYMGDRSVKFTYPICMVNQETMTLELGIDEIETY